MSLHIKHSSGQIFLKKIILIGKISSVQVAKKKKNSLYNRQKKLKPSKFHC